MTHRSWLDDHAIDRALCPSCERLVAAPHPAPGVELPYVPRPDEECACCALFAGYAQQTPAARALGVGDEPRRGLLRLWRIPIQRWVSATRRDGLWWTEDPPSAEIAQDLQLSDRVACPHHRDPCHALCGVRRVPEPRAAGREVDWSLDLSWLPEPGPGVLACEIGAETYYRCSVDPYRLVLLERLKLTTAGRWGWSLETVRATSTYGHYDRKTTEGQVSAGDPSVLLCLECTPTAGWPSILLRLRNIDDASRRIMISLRGRAVLDGYWEPIPKSDRVGWYDRAWGFEPNRRTYERMLEEHERHPLGYGVDLGPYPIARDEERRT